MTEIFRRQVDEEVVYLAHVGTRKLKAVWSYEAEQDLRFFINDISQQLSEQLLAELDNEELKPTKINWKKEGF